MEKFTITDKGKELQAKLISETETAAFTRLEISDYAYKTDDAEKLSSLKGVRQSVYISSVRRTDATMVEVIAAVDNRGVTSEYAIRTAGLYAQDSKGKEVLFGISVAGDHPDFMKPYADGALSEFVFRINVRVGNADNVTLEVNPQAYVTVEQFEEHIHDTVYDEDGVHGLRCMDGKLQGKNPEGNWDKISGGGGIYVGITAPDDTDLIWIDTSIGGVAKYYDLETQEWKMVLSVWA